jgi:hypothetical protein
MLGLNARFDTLGKELFQAFVLEAMITHQV